MNLKSSEKMSAFVIASQLASEGILSQRQVSTLKNRITGESVYEHAIEEIAARNWVHAKFPEIALNLDWLSKWTALNHKLELIDLSKIPSPPEDLILQLRKEYAYENNILLFSMENNKINVATSEPMAFKKWQSNLQRALQKEFKLFFANPKQLRASLKKYYKIDESSIGEQSPRFTQQFMRGVLNLKNTTNRNKIDPIHIIDFILNEAFELGASDIHVEPHLNESLVRFRIDGRLHDFQRLTNALISQFINRLKVQAGMDITEKRLPQDGRVRVRKENGNEIELRLSTMPTTIGEKLVARIFNPDVLVRPMGELGFSQIDQEIWDRMISHPHGLIIVTGPTGSGKTTTLYSSLINLASSEINISTIEDPVELFNERFNQMQVNESIGLTFPVGIKTLLRQDPDIIMIGEIRDSESAEVAIQAAMTGHLVLATMHTNDAPSTITRLLDLNIPPYLIKASLVGIVAQRLVRRLCEHCKTPTSISSMDWEFLVTPVRLHKPETIFREHGCQHCNMFGFKGRVAIYEMLYMTDSISRLITPATDMTTIRRTALRIGMIPLRVSGAKKIAEMETSLDEILRVVPPEIDAL